MKTFNVNITASISAAILKCREELIGVAPPTSSFWRVLREGVSAFVRCFIYRYPVVVNFDNKFNLLDGNGTYKELYMWCKENFGDRKNIYVVVETIYASWGSKSAAFPIKVIKLSNPQLVQKNLSATPAGYIIHFYFTKEEDAAFFKLTWK